MSTSHSLVYKRRFSIRKSIFIELKKENIPAIKNIQ